MTITKTSVSRSFPWFLIVPAAFACSFAIPRTSSAVPITVPNFSFEASDEDDGDFDEEPIPDWDITGTFNVAGAFNSTNSEYSGTTGGPLPAPADADHFGLANVSRDGTAGSNFVLFTSAASLGTVLDNTMYSLSVAVGSRITNSPDQVTLEFLVDDVVVPASTLSFVGTPLIPDDSFMDFTTSFTTAFFGDSLTGGDLKVRLTHSSLPGSGVATADFDNIRVDVTELPFVPEPSTFTLGVLGLAAMTRLRRRRRKEAAKVAKISTQTS